MKLRALPLAVATLALALTASAQKYRFPIELPSSGTQPNASSYRDEDTSGGVQDWNCGSWSYNGHKGTDFAIGGFAVMDAGSRWVVAAADGTVTFVNDGCDDHCNTGACGCGSGFGNYVRLQHADGKTTTYGHMMKGSIAVAMDAPVKCGQHLGKVGSSGNSTGPHVHFEPRSSGGTPLEPFSGPCGATSLWVSQGAYKGLPGDQCENPTPAEVDDNKLVSESPTAAVTVAPSAGFKKSWVVENTGNTTWSFAGGYTLAHAGGDSFSASMPATLAGGENIAPNAQKTWSLDLVAPATPGSYSGDFRMERTGKGAFGATLHLDVVVTDRGAGGGGASGGGGTPASGGASAGGGGGQISGTGSKPSFGGGSAAGNGAKPESGDVQGGCACRGSGHAEPNGLWALALLTASALSRRRR